MHKFEVGSSYAFSFAGDSSATHAFEVLKRSAKFVTIKGASGKELRVGVYEYDGAERCHPLGKYSLCPTLSADRVSTK